MEIRINKIEAKMCYSLTTAILIYENNSASMIASINPVEDTRSGPVIKPGTIIETKDLSKIFKEFKSKKSEAKFIASDILYSGKTLTIWTKEGHTEEILFKTDRNGLNKISGKNVQHPRLVFALSKTLLSVWACKDNFRPTPDTELYFAPYYNVSPEIVCMPGERKDTEKIERNFFASPFTHIGIKSPYGRETHESIWTENAKKTEKNEIYDFGKILISSGKKLKDIYL